MIEVMCTSVHVGTLLLPLIACTNFIEFYMHIHATSVIALCEKKKTPKLVHANSRVFKITTLSIIMSK